MDVKELFERVKETDLVQVIGHLNWEERVSILVRAVFLFTIACLVFGGTLNSGKLQMNYIWLSFFWIVATTVPMLFLKRNYRELLLGIHIADAAALVTLVWQTGGDAGVLAYTLPLLVIPAGLFVNGSYAIISATVLVIYSLYLFLSSNSLDGRNILFWIVYYGFTLAVTELLLTSRQVKKDVIIQREMEKRLSVSEGHMAKLEKSLTEHKITDDVSGLNNYRYFRKRVEEEVQRAKRYKYKFSVCVIGIDNLIDFESEFGAPERNRIVVRVSQQLKKAVRDTDQLGRFSKDQFLILLVGSDAKQAIVPAHRIAAGIGTISVGTKKKKRTFPASCGIAGYPDDGEDVGGLVGMATSALELSRSRGSGKITLASALYRRGPIIGGQ